MEFFDFHHHKRYITNGIFNSDIDEPIPHIPYSIGIHPKDINIHDINHQILWLKSNIKKNCFAIGECGLDSFVEVDQKLQEYVFLEQIKFANEIKKPIIIHCVRKFNDVISLKKYSKQPMIIHGFNKKQNVADSLIKENFYLSFGKALLYNLSLQNTFKIIPLNKIFLETDNDDFNIEELYRKVSDLKEISLEEVNKQIAENIETIKNG